MKEYSDLELNKMIAELEGLIPQVRGGYIITTKGEYSPCYNREDEGTDRFNKNKARLFDLMVKYKVNIERNPNVAYIWNGDSAIFKSESEIPRAIIMCILKSKNII